ncbi:MAG: cytochrome c oxidase assembly protein [Acidimicrobiia bacterium]|nr:cytochrome c oxidase assembly protein [Acidimicrobiia bacterium]
MRSLIAQSPPETPWTWEPRPDVWLLILAIAAGYVWSTTRLRNNLERPPPPPARAEKTRFFIGLQLLWLAVDWPLDRLGDDFLFSAHMVQFLLITMVAVPLVVSGIPGWLFAELTLPLAPVLRLLTRAPIALATFQLVLVGTHLPAVVELYSSSSVVHLGLHALWVLSAGLFWLPILGKEPLVSPLVPAGKVAYLIAATVLPTVPASFLTWATTPLYDSYAEAPRVWGLSPTDDLQLAGLFMKLGGGLILWGFIAWVFVSWTAEEASRDRRRRSSRQSNDASGRGPGIVEKSDA